MATYQLISSVTVGSGGASSIDFTSIPATYTDLLILTNARSTRTVTGYDDFLISFNSSSSSFSTRSLQGSGSAVSSFTSANFLGQLDTAANTASTFTNALIYIPNYAGSTNKSYSADVVQENNATAAYANITAGLWSNTAAITAIKLSAGIGNLDQYSTAYLYGIKNS